NRRVFIILGTIVGLFFLMLILLRSMGGSASMGQKVAVIDITGIITKSDATIKLIHAYRDDPSVKAIVMRVDSPGGSVAPVQEIYTELEKIEKPIVASMGGSAASGGYYIACAADTIFANPGTLTGSIGVIMQFTRMKGLYDKVGLEHQVIKSGQFKDTGSPFRTLTEEEQAVLQATVDDVHNQFVDTIAEARSSLLTRTEVVELADGRIFSGRQALDSKLIDQLGNLPDAIKIAGELGGIEGKPKVLRKQKKTSLFEQLIGIKQMPPFDEMFSAPGVTFRYQMNLGD
ncbi:signal peptide peptidase SppA, partial [Candidatus Poribacteria bacterium]|nr:signal peptide peptidase SppA [Candidatus Poribacteria bacterium]